MAVFTALSSDDFRLVETLYGLAIEGADGVQAGTVNTYYRLQTNRGLFYLRIDERGDPQAVERELAILSALKGLSVPHPVPTRDQALSIAIQNKPGILFETLPGASRSASGFADKHLIQIGQWLADLHRATPPTPTFPHRFHPAYLLNTLYPAHREAIRALSSPAFARLEAAQKRGDSAFQFKTLPQSLIHADLFEENLHFERDQLVGVLDFEAAGLGPRLLDVAIALHALTFVVDKKQFDIDKAKSLVDAYRGRIALEPAEIAAWPLILEYGGLRFLLTRLIDFEIRPPASGAGHRKDFREYLDHLDALAPVVLLVAG